MEFFSSRLTRKAGTLFLVQISSAHSLALGEEGRARAVLEFVRAALALWIGADGQVDLQPVPYGHIILTILFHSPAFDSDVNVERHSVQFSQKLAELARSVLARDENSSPLVFDLAGPFDSETEPSTALSDPAGLTDWLEQSWLPMAPRTGLHGEVGGQTLARAQRFARDFEAGVIDWIWDPVWCQTDAHAVYHDARPATLSASGLPYGRDDDWRDLERLGLNRPFEQALALALLDRVAGDPDLHLAMRIAPSSAQLDLWWLPVLDRLRRNPRLAGRLLVEIGAEGLLPPISKAVAFSSELAKLGCPIILGGFGGGDSSLHALMALRPYAVKLDPLFVRLAGRSSQGAGLFHHAVGLARALARYAIVPGIDSAEQEHRALREGIDWLQGGHVRPPSLSVSHSIGAFGFQRPAMGVDAPIHESITQPNLQPNNRGVCA